MNRLQEIDLKFKSGNEIPVKRASLTLEEWQYIKYEISKAKLGQLIVGAAMFFLGIAFLWLGQLSY